MANKSYIDPIHELELSGLRIEVDRLRQELDALRTRYQALQDEVGLYHFISRPALDLWLERHPGALEWPRLYEVLQWVVASLTCDLGEE